MKDKWTDFGNDVWINEDKTLAIVVLEDDRVIMLNKEGKILHTGKVLHNA